MNVKKCVWCSSDDKKQNFKVDLLHKYVYLLYINIIITAIPKIVHFIFSNTVCVIMTDRNIKIIMKKNHLSTTR